MNTSNNELFILLLSTGPLFNNKNYEKKERAAAAAKKIYRIFFLISSKILTAMSRMRVCSPLTHSFEFHFISFCTTHNILVYIMNCHRVVWCHLRLYIPVYPILARWNCSMLFISAAHTHTYQMVWLRHRKVQAMSLSSSLSAEWVRFSFLNKQYYLCVCASSIHFIKCNVPLLPFSSFLSTIHRMFCIHKEMNMKPKPTK